MTRKNIEVNYVYFLTITKQEATGLKVSGTFRTGAQLLQAHIFFIRTNTIIRT